MSKSNPSYLYLRNGIYYFQVRIPKSLSGDVYNSKLSFRKSTRTGNRREALQKSRHWWVQIMNDYDTKLKQIDEMNIALDRDDELYAHGKKIHKILEECEDWEDPNSDDLFVENVVTKFDKDALFTTIETKV